MSTCACDGTGWRLHAQTRELMACPECDVAVERDRERGTARLAAVRSELGALADCTFATFDTNRVALAPLTWVGVAWDVAQQRAALARAFATCQRYAAEPTGWLYIAGPYGAGKSHLAAAIAHEIAARGQSVAYSSVPAMLQFVRAGFDSGEFNERFTALCRVDLLVLDDLGAEKRTPWTDEQLFILINDRYLRNAPTVITSNRGLDAHEGRITSRIAGKAEEVVLPAADYRRRGAGGAA